VAKFMVLYRSSVSAQDQMADASPEQAQEGMDMWMRWAEKAGPAIVDLGTPLGGSRLVPSGAQRARCALHVGRRDPLRVDHPGSSGCAGGASGRRAHALCLFLRPGSGQVALRATRHRSALRVSPAALHAEE